MLLALTSCQSISFYHQAVRGQMEILVKARSNETVIRDPATSDKLKRQLQSVQEIREFASHQLGLPGDESYGKYSDLGREHVVWVLYAAPEFSLDPKKWRYPAVGEMDYRGYFKEADTIALAADLKGQGYDVFVGGVDAYSTLGLFHDPVLNTFVDYPDIDLAETIFHELTHRVVFKRGDTIFNESLANVVAEEGVQRWLKAQGRFADLTKYRERLVRRRDFYQEVDRARGRLKRLYESDVSPSVMRVTKAIILEDLRNQFRELRRRWGGRGLESWLEAELNNANIVSLDLYYQKMPAFRTLLDECDGDLQLFYQKAEHFKIDSP